MVVCDIVSSCFCLHRLLLSFVEFFTILFTMHWPRLLVPCVATLAHSTQVFLQIINVCLRWAAILSAN